MDLTKKSLKHLTRKRYLTKKSWKGSSGRWRKNTQPKKWISTKLKAQKISPGREISQKKLKNLTRKGWKRLTRKRDISKKDEKTLPGREKLENSHQEEGIKDCKAAENVDEAWFQVHFLFLREHQEADDVT